MAIPWLQTDDDFPPVQQALLKPNGLLAAGADLSPQRLLQAYRRGIFPWFSPGEPILWWSPDPRMVLFPAELHLGRSLRKDIRKNRFRLSLDEAFSQVVQHCANINRPGQQGTWISTAMFEAYQQLHNLGYAHSAEAWLGEQLVGGLYGVSIGRVFYGESMFALCPNASKIAFARLIPWLKKQGVGLVDCQVSTEHLGRFGARTISRAQFSMRLQQLTSLSSPPSPWQYTADDLLLP